MSSSGNKVQELVRETAACSVNGSANTGKLIFREKPETTKQEDSNGKKPVKDAKTFRMNLFREAEVVFPGTFRQNAPVGRTLSIRSNAVISAASGSDIQDTAGSFGFPEESGLENRFIIWRALGPNITFEEYSADCDPQGAVLCLHFEHCSIIKGTKIYFSGERLVIVVPTHRSVHRFYIDLSELERPESLNDIAVLSLLPTGEDLDVVHHEHVFTTTGNASACEITMLATDQTLLAGHFQDGQLVSVIMPSLIHSNQHSRGDERVLKTSGFLARLMRTEEKWQVVDQAVTFQGLIYALYSDFQLRVWNAQTQQVVQTIDLLRQIGEDPADLRPVAIKTTLLKTRIVITINVKHGATTKLLFFSPVADELTFLAQINGDPKGELLDTEITEGVRSEHALCWGIRRNGPKAKCRYNLATCELDFRDCKEEWTEVMNVVSLDPLPCKTALRRERIAHLKRRIFGGDEFTIEVLLRTINMECKGTDQRTFLHDYPNIQNYVEEFVENIYLKQMRERNAVLAMDKSGVESAAESFWKKFLTTCEEFQATAGFLPIVIWTAPELELVGVIQQARFTVCIDNDEEMERMLHPHFTNQEAEKLYGIISEASNVWKRMDAEIEDQLIRLRGAIVGYMKNIRSLAMNFADLSPFDGHDRPRAAMFEYRNSLFAAGLLSATLRRYVLKRYEFAQSLCDIVIFGVPRVLKSGQLKKVVEDRDFVSRVRAMYTSFKVLTNALCFRVTCRLPSAAGDSVEGSTNSKRMCVAEAFFALGGPTLFSSGNTIPSTVEVEMMENSELAALEGEERENYIRSRTRRRSSIATHPFHRFVQDCSFGSVLFLWPGSPELMLPRFLRKQGMFYALQHYCTFNDSSLDADLTCTVRFYQGVAYAGTGLGEKALIAFQDVAKNGLTRNDEDDPLNRAFLTSNLRYEVPRVTRTTYYIDVLSMLEEYGHTTQVLQLGQSALTSELSEPLMQEIFTILFRTQINIKDYAAALMTLRRNPIREKKMFALRDLLGQLIVQNQWKTLLDLDYLDVNPNVLLYLKGRAEGSDVGYAGQLYNIAGGCYYKAKLFRKAAKLYYELATRLIPLCTNIDALSRRAEALLICHSTLKLESDEDLQWIERIDRPEVNIQSDESMANEEAAEAQKAEIHIYNLEDIRNEWFLETMRLRIANKDDPNFRHGAPSTEPRLIVAELVRLKQYDYAWRVIGKFKVDPSDFFQAVTIDCIKSDLRRDKSRFPMWVYRNMEFCWHSKEPINKHWKILETYLNQYEVEDNVGDPRMKRTILYTILTHAATIPEWLAKRYRMEDFGDFLRCLLDFGDITECWEYCRKYFEFLRTELSDPRKLNGLELPINMFDDLLALAKDAGTFEKEIAEFRKALELIFNIIVTIERADTRLRGPLSRVDA